MQTTLKILTFSAGLWFLFLVCLPILISTSVGQKFALNLLNQKSSGTITADKLSISWTGPQLFEKFRFFNSDGSFSAHCEKLEIDSSLLNLLLPGKRQVPGKATDLLTQFKKSKTSQRDFNFSKLNFDLTADIYKTELSDIKLQLAGSQLSLSIEGSLANGIFTLRKPLEGLMEASTTLSKKIIEEVLPLFQGLIKGQKPIHFVIEPKGFALPLRNFSVRNLQIGRAVLELDVLSFENSGPLAKVLKLFTTGETKEISLWIMPAHFSVVNGIIDLKRTDMFAMNKYPLAIWGKIDLPLDKINMTLGLSIKALAQKANIPLTQGKGMLLLPLTGSMSNVEVNSNSVKIKLALLAAQFFKKTPKSIDEVTQKISDSLENEEIPEPASPLPWEDQPQN